MLWWGKSSILREFITLISVGFFVRRLDVVVVDFIVVLEEVLREFFDLVVNFSVFFFNAAAVFDFGEDDLVCFD